MNDNEISQEYRLGSSQVIYSPGVIAWAVNGYKFKGDRDRMIEVVMAGWAIPEYAAVALLSESVPYTIEGEVVVFWA